MRIKILGAAIMALALTAAPAVARHLTYSQGPTQSIFCATRQAGNPYSKYCDYMAWSGWRRRGGWDSSLDNACLRNPRTCPMAAYRFRLHCQAPISRLPPSRRPRSIGSDDGAPAKDHVRQHTIRIPILFACLEFAPKIMSPLTIPARWQVSCEALCDMRKQHPRVPDRIIISGDNPPAKIGIG
jgi:hypothetical protein